ncbi:MAG TPA: cell division topological specificity factor MinE [Candidatus Fimimorpha excrementavium]|nr:cell division topological specificity factor MinE [Candidatus Fimimorpha excrementavium]
MGLMDFFKKKNSGNVAKDRLKLLLVSERADCSPEIMEMIKNDIIQVISKYMEIDTEGLDIQITKNTENGDQDASPALYANIPIKGRKRTENK